MRQCSDLTVYMHRFYRVSRRGKGKAVARDRRREDGAHGGVAPELSVVARRVSE